MAFGWIAPIVGFPSFVKNPKQPTVSYGIFMTKVPVVEMPTKTIGWPLLSEADRLCPFFD